MTVAPTFALPRTCNRCVVRSRSLCGRLAPPDLVALNAISLQRSYDPGQIVVGEGDPDLFANVISGMAVEKKTLRDGREQIISLLFPADFLGHAFQGQADATVEAVSPLLLCSFDRHQFSRIVTATPKLNAALVEHSQTELLAAREWLLLLGQKSARERVATFLVRLIDRTLTLGCHHVGPPDALMRGGGHSILRDDTQLHADAVTVELPITRAQMASYLGLTIETVSRKLTELRRANLIRLEGKRLLTVSSTERLRALCG